MHRRPGRPWLRASVSPIRARGVYDAVDDFTAALGDRGLLNFSHLMQMIGDNRPQGIGQHGRSVFLPFAVPHDDLIPLEIDVFDANPQTFH